MSVAVNQRESGFGDLYQPHPWTWVYLHAHFNERFKYVNELARWRDPLHVPESTNQRHFDGPHVRRGVNDEWASATFVDRGGQWWVTAHGIRRRSHGSRCLGKYGWRMSSGWWISHIDDLHWTDEGASLPILRSELKCSRCALALYGLEPLHCGVRSPRSSIESQGCDERPE